MLLESQRQENHGCHLDSNGAWIYKPWQNACGGASPRWGYRKELCRINFNPTDSFTLQGQDSWLNQPYEHSFWRKWPNYSCQKWRWKSDVLSSTRDSTWGCIGPRGRLVFVWRAAVWNAGWSPGIFWRKWGEALRKYSVWSSQNATKHFGGS